MVRFYLAGRLLHDRFVNIRVEGLAHLTEAFHPFLFERILKLGGDRSEGAFLQVAVLACGVNIVEHRQKQAHNIARHKLPKLLFLAGGTVLEVRELRLQAKQAVQAFCREFRIL